MSFRENILLFTLIPLLVFLASYSVSRFIVNQDYVVAYQGTCDPATESCFVGCEDDACTTSYYYTNVQKYAADLYAQCGKDITDCDDADRCLPFDNEKCAVVYCDAATDGDACETLPDDAPDDSTTI